MGNSISCLATFLRNGKHRIVVYTVDMEGIVPWFETIDRVYREEDLENFGKAMPRENELYDTVMITNGNQPVQDHFERVRGWEGKGYRFVTFRHLSKEEHAVLRLNGYML